MKAPSITIQQAERVDALLADILHASGLDLTYTIKASEPSTGRSERLQVDFTGPDANMLVARNAELLLALEQLAVEVLRLPSDEHHHISFEALQFKARRQRQLQQSAAAAIREVRTTGRPFAFAPMSSRERRLLHLELASSGLHTASVGEGPLRHLVLHPAR